MKANRKFVQADEAVSPVIAVILMVAITVVLAATVFVLVSDIGSQTGKSAPTLSIRTDESLDRLVIDSAASGADWNRIAVKTKQISAGIANVGAVASPFQNEATAVYAADANDMSAADLEITGTNDPINAADFVEFCGSAAAVDFVVTVVDTTANTAIGDYTFLTLAVCA